MPELESCWVHGKGIREIARDSVQEFASGNGSLTLVRATFVPSTESKVS
jgi:hypothetical protein